MKKRPKKVSVLYRDMTQREKDKLPLSEQFRLFFNEYRDAGIREIVHIVPDKGVDQQVGVRYFDGRKLLLPDVLTWTYLFDKLNEMHPKPVKPVTIKYKGETYGIEPVGGKRVRMFCITTDSWTTARHDELVTWLTDRHVPKKKAETLVKDALGFDPGPFRPFK